MSPFWVNISIEEGVKTKKEVKIFHESVIKNVINIFPLDTTVVLIMTIYFIQNKILDTMFKR